MRFLILPPLIEWGSCREGVVGQRGPGADAGSRNVSGLLAFHFNRNDRTMQPFFMLYKLTGWWFQDLRLELTLDNSEVEDAEAMWTALAALKSLTHLESNIWYPSAFGFFDKVSLLTQLR